MCSCKMYMRLNINSHIHIIYSKQHNMINAVIYNVKLLCQCKTYRVQRYKTSWTIQNVYELNGQDVCIRFALCDMNFNI